MRKYEYKKIITSKECRLLARTKCKLCEKKTKWRRKDHLTSQNNTYCSVKCASISRTTSEEKICKICNKVVKRSLSERKKNQSGNYFCSRHCAIIFHNRERIDEKHPNYKEKSYRKRALRIYGEKCSRKKCPISKPIDVRLLDVDHIDGNRSNNKILNLQVLCVYCHAIKTRIKSK